MPEKEPKKVKKAPKSETENPPKKARKTSVKKSAAAKETAPASEEKREKKPAVKRSPARPKKTKTITETPAPVKKSGLEESEESEIGAAKFYPQQPISLNIEKKPETPQEKDETQIPERYYDNKLVLMARDPYWCYAYWDISDELLEKKKAEAAKSGSYKVIIRIYDVTDIMFDGNNAHKYMDIEVTDGANNWYINVWSAGRTYIAELGLLTAFGKFICIARSNSVGTPNDKVSDREDEEFMEVGENFEEIMRVSGAGVQPGITGGSQGFGGLTPSGLGSDTVSSFSSADIMPKNERGFFLWADTELILYGGTEKDAKLTVKGEKIMLKQDGTFTLRFHLPDGVIDLPISAESADGSEKRSLKIEVKRKTE